MVSTLYCFQVNISCLLTDDFLWSSIKSARIPKFLLFSVTAPVFGFLSGTLTEGETVTAALGGNPPPFAVIFSDRSSGGQATTVTTVTASDLPSTAGLLAGPESEDFFSLIIPTLT